MSSRRFVRSAVRSSEMPCGNVAFQYKELYLKQGYRDRQQPGYRDIVACSIPNYWNL